MNIRKVRYWVLSDQAQGYCRPSKGFPFTKMQTVSTYNSTLVQAKKLYIKHVYSSDYIIQNV